MSIKDWSTSAGGNTAPAGINWAEGQAPSTVNNSAREMMAQIRTEYVSEKWGWIAQSGSASVRDATTVVVPGDVTSDAVVNRKIKFTGGSVGVFYADIVTASYGTETAITIANPTNALSNSISVAWLSAIYDKNLPSNVVTGTDTSTFTAEAIFQASVSFSATVNFASQVNFNESVSFSASVQFNDAQVIRPYFKDYAEAVNAIGSTGGGTQDIDLTLGNIVTATVDTSENTFTFSNPSATGRACSFTLILTNGGSQTVNWPASVDWAAATAPTLTTAGVDIIEFFTVDAGTIWYGFAAGLDMS